MNEKIYDVAIIGAGVIGGMIARNLSKYNLEPAALSRLYTNQAVCVLPEFW